LPRVNEKITNSEVRLVDQDGAVLGITPTYKAIEKAKLAGMDLVEVSPNVTPPVCKMMDFGKYRYDTKKKMQQSKKKQKTAETKEIRLRPTIGAHDLQIKITQIHKFLTSKEKVRLSLRFKGREITHHELGLNIVNNVINSVSDVSAVESPPKIEGKQILCLLVPKG
jgi:translation initiation factor IF-3